MQNLLSSDVIVLSILLTLTFRVIPNSLTSSVFLYLQNHSVSNQSATERFAQVGKINLLLRKMQGVYLKKKQQELISV